MCKRIYADNAATTELSRDAYEAMIPYLRKDYGNASQLYSFARSPKKALKESREIIAECIGALPEEIFFTSCGTESNNWVVSGAAHRGMNVITSVIEHHAILRPCEYFSTLGLHVEFLPVDELGLVNASLLWHKEVNAKTLVSVMFANNEIGSIQPISEMVEICHSIGGFFHTDAVQAVGHVGINVKELGVDMLSASAHKFNGPKGIGFLYIRKGLEWPSFMMGGAQENNHRAGTENVASIVGMAIALQENTRTIDDNARHLKELEDCILSQLSSSGVDFVRNGPKLHIPGNVSLSFRGHSAEAILHRLDLQGIFISTGAACDSKKTEISHVLKAIGLDDELAKGTIRISLGKNNTIDDAMRIGEVLSKIVSSEKVNTRGR